MADVVCLSLGLLLTAEPSKIVLKLDIVLRPTFSMVESDFDYKFDLKKTTELKPN